MTEVVEAHRARLFGIAYRMLGSVTEAEDVVQDAFARFTAATGVEEPAAWLTRVVTNLSIDRLRSARHQRETYVGPWLPEPLLTEDHDPADVVGTAESLTLAFLVVLERLSPLQRAVFLLHDVFGYRHDEVAGMLDRTPAAVRQLASRARSQLADRHADPAAPAPLGNAITAAFLAACEGGDLGALMELLAPDVVLTSDGGGVVSAARRPLVGVDAVGRFLLGLTRIGRGDDWEVRPTEVNGEPGLVVGRGGSVEGVFVLHVADERIAAIHVVRNPDKLAGLRRALSGPA